jgi:hypothetical protein
MGWNGGGTYGLRVDSSRAADNGLRSWAKFTVSGGVVSIGASLNVSSITRQSAGNFTYNFATAIGDGQYAITGTMQYNGIFSVSGTPASGSFVFICAGTGGGGADPTYCGIHVVR